MNTLNDTPSAQRIHIGFFGKRNSGKSSLINALTGQNVSIVSDIKGTTTDAVSKPMEIHGIGPCVIIDTAGFDDIGELGGKRIEKTNQAMLKTDIAVLLFNDTDCEQEFLYFDLLRSMKTKTICVISKSDKKEKKDNKNIDILSEIIKDRTGQTPLPVNIHDKNTIEKLKELLVKSIPQGNETDEIVSSLVNEKDVVLLVMPQDIQAPKGRLILPQVQTIRNLLDNKCTAICTTKDQYLYSLSLLRSSPNMIITDSQCFNYVYENKPEGSLLTSFSVLFAALKGDIKYFIDSIKHLEKMNEDSCILIAEACSHAPLDEDIGRVKIPALLRKKLGPKLKIDVVAGNDFPVELSRYDLVIHCGGCMFNKKHIMSRVALAKEQNIPMSNYGITIAYLNGILDKIVY